MNVIELTDLLWCLPLLAVSVLCYWYWLNNFIVPSIAVTRMLLQLLVAGFLLVILFEWSSPLTLLAVMCFMLFVSTFIAFRPLRQPKQHMLPMMIASIVSVSCVFFISILLIIKPSPWYQGTICIPLAGMYFAQVMNSLSISAERLESDMLTGNSLPESQKNAFNGAMIPQINSLLAVGLVALPGMMTGQIIAGGSTMIAVRYQIMIMALLFSSSTIAVTIYLKLFSLYCRSRDTDIPQN